MVARGASAVSIENIHTQAQENVVLDPARSVFDNAEMYYRKSRKGKRSVSIIEKKLAETREEETVLARILEGLGSLR